MTKIAMWSGPRNLSTAMMYSFAARGDCAVWDEPFYAPYLAETGQDHPMRAQILAAHETDPDQVAATCAGPVPEQKQHWYMKHMPHHMMDGFSLDWAQACVNVHLLRHPARVIASYAAKRDVVTMDDIGFVQQHALWKQLPGPVVDSFDIRQDPENMLALLCQQIGISFEPSMLSWAQGGVKEDGVWAAHWYGAVHRSCGFAGPEGDLPELTADHRPLLEQALPYYEEMRGAALRL